MLDWRSLLFFVLPLRSSCFVCFSNMPATKYTYQTSFEALHSAAAAHIRKDGISTHRDHVLQLGVLVGHLCSSFLAHAPLDAKRTPLSVMSPVEKEDSSSFWMEDSQGREEMAEGMGRLLWALVLAAEMCHMDLGDCILKKIVLNSKKYPVELVKGKSGKYTAYSDQTGITKTEGQSTRDLQAEGTKTVEEVTGRIRVFATERLWSRYHTPRNLVLALMGELGELAELFQWRGDDPESGGMEGWSQDDLDHVGQEFADVAIYLLRLADVCHVKNIGTLALSHSVTIAKDEE
jgi:NTP pyrophosphatase (non-canonical NTP hydrolase)